MIADTPELVNAYRLLSLKGALKLETLGLRHSSGSVASRVREVLKSRTKNKAALLAEFIDHLKAMGILQA